jgi:DNA-directed RNA polymerase subunit M/transcription elongation factor TFIIS
MSDIKLNQMQESSIDYNQVFIKSFNEKWNSFPSRTDKKGFQKEYVNRYKFKTHAGNDISYSLVIEAEKCIDRKSAVKELQKYLKEFHLAHSMERGLFEFSLIRVKIDDVPNHFVGNIYSYQLEHICRNLDINDESIGNKTLLPMICEDGFDPYLVPFLPAEQMHPQKWANVVRKRDLQNETANNFQTTDIYTCKRCKMKKFRIMGLQTRSADEPETLFITCMNCYFTFTQ